MIQSPTATTDTPSQIEATRGFNPGSEGLVRSAFDNVALLIGSAAVIHHLDDDLTWTLMKRLDRIRIRLLRELRGFSPREDSGPTAPQPPRVHAAVEEFLRRNGAGMGE
jgi:hypothetical protein